MYLFESMSKLFDIFFKQKGGGEAQKFQVRRHFRPPNLQFQGQYEKREFILSFSFFLSFGRLTFYSAAEHSQVSAAED